VTGRAATVVLAAVLAARAARAADVCPQGNDPTAGPLAGGIGPADFGAVPEACGATEVALRARGELLIASTMPDYYGRIVATATARGRYQVAARSTLSFAADVFDYGYFNNGGLASQGASAGPATVGFHQTFAAGSETAASLYARALLPLDTARQNSIEAGLELGGTLRVPAGARLVFDGGLAVVGPLDVAGGQVHGRLESGALAEAWLRLRPSFAFGGGVAARVKVAPAFDLITIVPRLGARLALRRRWWAAVLAEVPVAGSDRTDLVAGLYAGFSP